MKIHIVFSALMFALWMIPVCLTFIELRKEIENLQIDMQILEVTIEQARNAYIKRLQENSILQLYGSDEVVVK